MQDSNQNQISVCLPVFNGESHLASCLERILAQTYSNFEILISDDCSTDTTWKIVEKYAALDSRVKPSQNNTHLGLLKNFNYSFSLAKSEFIKPLTQNTVLELKAFERLVAILGSNSEVALASSFYQSNHPPRQNQFSLPPQMVSSLNKPIKGLSAIRKSLFPAVNFIGNPNQVLFRRKWLGSGFDTNFSQLADLDLWLRILLMGSLFQTNEALCANQNDDDYSQFAQSSTSFFPEILLLGKKFADLMPKLGASEEKYLEIAASAFPCFSNESKLKTIATNKSSNYALAFQEIANSAFNNRIETQPESFFYKRNIEKVIMPIASREKRVRKILNSLSWRLTCPLRNLNKLLGYNTEFLDLAKLQLTDDLENQNILYLHYLHAQIMALLTSRSWTLTSWMRQLRLPAKSSYSAQTSRVAVKKTNQQSRPSLTSLPPISSPANSYNLAIAAIFRNEASFLTEWIEFHRLVGCQKFFLFNNLSTDNFDTVLKPYIAAGIVELIDWNLESQDKQDWKNVQGAAYETALGLATTSKVRWLAFIDIDEYLFASAEEKLVDVLSSYENFGGVAVNWQLFGPTAAEEFISGNLLIETSVKAAEEKFADNTHIKSIVRPERVERCVNSHFFTYKYPYYAVTTDFNKVTDAKIDTVSVDRLRINHYRYKTIPFLHSEKRERFISRGNVFLLTPNYLKQLEARIDNTIHRFLPELKKQLPPGFKTNQQATLLLLNK